LEKKAGTAANVIKEVVGGKKELCNKVGERLGLLRKKKLQEKINDGPLREITVWRKSTRILCLLKRKGLAKPEKPRRGVVGRGLPRNTRGLNGGLASRVGGERGQKKGRGGTFGKRVRGGRGEKKFFIEKRYQNRS